MSELELIEGYKKDFTAKTGRSILVKVCSRWESLCQLPAGLQMDTVLNLIFDATGWSYDTVFTKRRFEESLFKRGLVYFILANNEYSLLKIARRTDKEHTTIINARKKFELQLESEPLTSRILSEVMDYIRNNYQYYI